MTWSSRLSQIHRGAFSKQMFETPTQSLLAYQFGGVMAKSLDK